MDVISVERGGGWGWDGMDGREAGSRRENLLAVQLLRKFMSKSLVGDHECWMSAYPSSQGEGVVTGAYVDYIVDDLLAAGHHGQ